MNPIVIDVEKSFENGEVDVAHAIDTMARFLRTVTETGELKSDLVDIEKFSCENDHVEDIVDQLGMELAVCGAIKQICNKILVAVERRETSNEKAIDGLNELINR